MKNILSKKNIFKIILVLVLVILASHGWFMYLTVPKNYVGSVCNNKVIEEYNNLIQDGNKLDKEAKGFEDRVIAMKNYSKDSNCVLISLRMNEYLKNEDQYKKDLENLKDLVNKNQSPSIKNKGIDSLDNLIQNANFSNNDDYYIDAGELNDKK